MSERKKMIEALIEAVKATGVEESEEVIARLSTC